MVVNEQNLHLVPHHYSLKFKRANLAVTCIILQRQCYQKY